MPFPVPRPGLVIHYFYLWHNQHRYGEVEGRKDRPCVILLAKHELDGETSVLVAPITHSLPTSLEYAVEVPLQTKQRLGLDTEPLLGDHQRSEPFYLARR